MVYLRNYLVGFYECGFEVWDVIVELVELLSVVIDVLFVIEFVQIVIKIVL